MRRARLGATGAAMALALPACTSLRPAQAPSHHFMERNQLAVVTVRDTSILYEGQLAPHIFLADGLPAAYHRVSSVPVSGAVAAWRVFVTPMFRIRQLADSSAAVRTPSFIPRVAMERTWVRPHGERSHDDFNAWFARQGVADHLAEER